MKTTWTIRGTHCNSCKEVIEDIIKEDPSVKSCTVDFKSGKTVIEHEKDTDLGKIKKEIESVGQYKVQ